MPMRGGLRRARDGMTASVRSFAWDASVIATLRHCTLPWFDSDALEIPLAAVPLESFRSGNRDRLSILAQFAAHQAFLHYAGINDGELDPAEWAVVSKRGADCRLVRVAARVPDAATAPPHLTLAQQFAEAIQAPSLEVLGRSWARAEAVYIEAFDALVRDAAADLRWMRRAGWGEVVAPGAAGLRALAETTQSYADERCLESLRRLTALDPSIEVVFLGGGSPLHRFSALDALRPFSGDEAAVADAVTARLAGKRVVMAVACGSIDPASQRVLDILEATCATPWLKPGQPATLEGSRAFVIAPRLSALRAVEERDATWISSFVETPAFDAFLHSGDIPLSAGVVTSLGEPKRSYVAALALLGTRVPRDLAERFLHHLDCNERLEELVATDIASIDDGFYVFASDAVREQIVGVIPATSRPELCRMASTLTDGARSAQLAIDAGDLARGGAVLDVVEWSNAAELINVVDRVPRAVLAHAPALAVQYAHALVNAGRYRDAKDLAPLLPGDERELVLAAAERRMGDYLPALARLERIDGRSEANLLRAELLLLLDRGEEAGRCLAGIAPVTADQRVRLGYLHALLAIEAGLTPDESWQDEPHATYYASRLHTYECTARGDHAGALTHIAQSLDYASTLAERIDALLDRMFALFSAGQWDEARRQALEGLAVVDESQGDRAAGGFLFTHAYLCADDGQWAQAEQRITRLRSFYSGVHDERRLAEIDLLTAHLDFSRGRFATAKSAAGSLLPRHVSPQIREAAALIVDEVNWIENRGEPLVSRGSGENLELNERHHLMRTRRGMTDAAALSRFHQDLAAWEKGQRAVPAQATRSEMLKVFRSAIVTRDRNTARTIAERLGCDWSETAGSPESDELRVLQLAASSTFPFAAHVFGVDWRFATRNRLNQWSEIGSLPRLTPAEIHSLSARPDADAMACCDREMLMMAGLGRWRAASRAALAAIFHTRAENERLRRVIAQDEVRTTPRTAGDGIVGESAVIREVQTRITLAAHRDVPVCILGESGTGKELVARSIHRQSPRKQKTFTAVNCAALPENLIESELFGHVRGAFTGADRDRTGLIEASDAGTLFLDEIGELPLTAQAKLLRFLQEGEFRRVGDTQTRSADVRVVSATNRKLEDAVERGKFREDLYYRIAVFEITLPPLRERGADVALLAAHFLAQEREREGSGPGIFSADAEAVLMSYRWPGNIRELQNTIRGAHTLAGESRQIEVEHLPERVRQVTVVRASAGSFQHEVARFRRELIERSLAEVRGNQSRAAALLKLSRQALAYQIRELGIRVGKTSRGRADV